MSNTENSNNPSPEYKKGDKVAIEPHYLNGTFVPTGPYSGMCYNEWAVVFKTYGQVAQAKCTDTNCDFTVQLGMD